ncbi:LOW QUALITY PROTEIN: adenylate-forming reductase 03009 [Diospyros lotus]|uniref:LOW QUALITY PROTEIN: adenylate-forming reductase 03009 n=1 Tax=Diospyros lotus TaxID=55363 RepID=UPI0022533380|nr:LOW QUALITY PROTEIN: adenylate-forming reductase 03009 [Diospyros lotus]
MENLEKIGRFSSCRGVSFEIKPHFDPFAITTLAINRALGNKRFWLPWGSSSKIVLFSVNVIPRSTSRARSHFCDLWSLKMTTNMSRDHKSSRLSIILLDQGIFTIYKRLFVFFLALNLTGVVLAANGNFQYGRNKVDLFSIVNILILTLCRSEAFLRVIFWLATKLFGRPWLLFRLKTTVTSLLQSLGGIHSGCGISAIAWLVYALVLTLKKKTDTSPEIITVALTILSLLCFSSLAAFPLFLHLHHNVFEWTHRFAGWAALGLL